MRLILPVLLALCAAPAFAQTPIQTTASVEAPPMPPAAIATIPATPAADNSNPSVDYAALRAQVARQNKLLTDQVATQRAIVKKNEELLKETQKLLAANDKLAQEKKRLEARNAELEHQREALKAAQKPAEAN